MKLLFYENNATSSATFHNKTLIFLGGVFHEPESGSVLFTSPCVTASTNGGTNSSQLDNILRRNTPNIAIKWWNTMNAQVCSSGEFCIVCLHLNVVIVTSSQHGENTEKKMSHAHTGSVYALEG